MNKRPHYVKHPGRAAAATAAALGTLAGDAAFERFAHISFANKAPHHHFQHDPGSTSPETTEKAAAVNICSLSGSVPGTQSAPDICSPSCLRVCEGADFELVISS